MFSHFISTRFAFIAFFSAALVLFMMRSGFTNMAGNAFYSTSE